MTTEFKPVVGENLGEINAPRYQEITIGSDRPLKCSMPRCRDILDTRTPFMIVQADGKTIIIHLSCLGINASGQFTDPAYLGHIRRMFVDKLIGR